MKRRVQSVAKALALAAVLGLVVPGCVERTMTVRSDPPGALVYLDDVERGETPCTFPFDFYGDRTLVLHKDNYEIAKQVIAVKPPLYSAFPLDTFFDLLFPFTIHENHAYDVVLQPVTKPDTEKLILRGKELREQLQAPQ